jgi:Tfp pilus assembly protein FimT
MITFVIATIVAIAGFALGSRYTEQQHEIRAEIETLYSEINEARREAQTQLEISERHIQERIDEILRWTNELTDRINATSKKVK